MTHPAQTVLRIAALSLLLGSPAMAQTAPEFAAEMRAMREELRQLRAELDAVRRQQTVAAPAPALAPVNGSASAATGAATPTAASAMATAAVPAGTPPTAAADLQAGSPLSLFGYGEMNLNRPRDASASVATARRGVIGFAYRFNERTRMAAELEIENAVVSAGDQGEVAFEQLYIEHDINEKISLKSGLFLMPVGYLNESHEPTRFYGVERNLIETAIIPSTWRELGLGLRGTTDAGLRWDAGIVTSFDLTKWDGNSTDGRASPLGAIHQEGQLAKARNLAAYGALNYNGIPGFNVGASLYGGGVGHKQAGFAAPDARLTLAEVHARWQPGQWDLSTLAATGRFSGVSALNASLAGQATPVPSSFGGWYAQAAYKVWQSGDYSLMPFSRYERLNTAKGYDGLPTGLAPASVGDTRVLTAGVNFYLHPQVVLKLDLQRYLNDRALDRMNLGVGFHF